MVLDFFFLDILLTDADGKTVLHHTAECGSRHLFQYLIGSGSDVFSKTKDKQNSLHIAAVNGHADLCKTLLEIYNRDILLTDADGKTVLHYAAKSGNLHLFQYLLGKGSDIFSKTKDKQNCLHFAASAGHVALCKTFLRTYNFDINLADDFGRTALHYVVANGNGCLSFLFQKVVIFIGKRKKILIAYILLHQEDI